jgi:hypothetical protein
MRLHENVTLFRQSIEFAAKPSNEILNTLKLISTRIQNLNWKIDFKTS